MARSYSSIRKQIESLERQAEAVKRKEVSGVVERIKEAIAHYGLSAQDLGFAGGAASSRAAPRAKSSKSGKSTRPVKYADDQGNTWVGFGKPPVWFQQALAAGKTKEDLLVKGARAKSAKAAPARKANAKSPKARKAGVIRFRDDQGHTWTGVGKRPNWFLQALAAGKTPDDLRA
ncbi:MAG TPA: H-NS family nucleoid-associated regulatory protein [Burkholderiaceae bacterium]|nr:H-NS family nucleoid-associated regulatory protein [Burkholderiaceae bacterium]